MDLVKREVENLERLQGVGFSLEEAYRLKVKSAKQTSNKPVALGGLKKAYRQLRKSVNQQVGE